jgi:membrane protein YdbS with pleckstrin-like domain
MTTETPINLRLNSFASFDDAMDMCDLLNRETGDKYTVMPDNHLGFTAKKCHGNPSGTEQGSSSIKAKDDLGGDEYRQTFRGFIPHYLEIAFGMALVTNPYKVIGLTFYLLNIHQMPDWLNLKGWGEILGIAGFLLLLYGLRFVYSYFAVKLCFDNDGVILKKGIIAQSQVQIRFGDIKTIGVEQGIIDRLLGIGSIHLDSAGTNGTVDIIMDNLIDPVLMRRQIQHMIDQYVKHERR